jgi:hypothetical protein
MTVFYRFMFNKGTGEMLGTLPVCSDKEWEDVVSFTAFGKDYGDCYIGASVLYDKWRAWNKQQTEINEELKQRKGT